jgi:dTDP-4-dehydrorhamnose reductase
MKHKKILILGANGQLGQEFVNILSDSKFNFVAPQEKDCDITDSAKLSAFVTQEAPEIVINCAAYNAVDDAEANPAVADLVNYQAVANIATICKEKNIFFVHYSSDYVFDGTKGELYTEEDTVNPLNVYGKSKLAGEQAIQKLCANFLIFRLSWVIGKGKQNFLYKLSGWAQNNKVLKISADEVSVPTFTNTVVDITLLALEEKLTGLYHLTNSGYASRYELAKAFIVGKKLDNLVVPVPMSTFTVKAARPLFAAMSNAKLSKALDVEIPTWQEALIKFIELKSY